MRSVGVPDAFLRLAALAAILAGILLIAGFVLHPAGEDATNGTNPMWVPAHALLWMAMLIGIIGWAGIYLMEAAEAGMVGMIGFILLIVGASFVSWIYSSDVTFVPVIARESTQLFKKIFSAGHVLIGVVSVLVWVLGNVLFGVSVVRAAVLSRIAGVLLLGTIFVPIAYLAGFSTRVVAIGAFIDAAGQIWLGIDLMRMLNSSAHA